MVGRSLKHGRDGEGANRYPSTKFMRLAKEVVEKKATTKVFDGLVFVVVDLMEDIHHLKELIRSNGGSLSIVISKKVSYLIATYSEVKANTYKIETASKYKIPIVSVQYILDCAEADSLLDHVPYMLVGDVEYEEEAEEEQSILKKTPAKQPRTPSAPNMINDFKYKPTFSSSTTHYPFFTRAFLGPNQVNLPSNHTKNVTALSPSINLSSNNRISPSYQYNYIQPTATTHNFNRPTLQSNTLQFSNNSSNPIHRSISSNELHPAIRPNHSGMAKIYDISDPKAPFFPEKYKVVKNDVLHFTDLAANINKYYGMEIHEAKESGKSYYRIYTTYGKTDDLLEHSTGESTRKVDCRYLDNLKQALILYDLIYKEKVSHKGYEVVSLASKTVGSSKEEKRERDIEAELNIEDKEPLAPEVRELVHYLYSEASLALKERIAGRITERGIETPLGILSLSQIEQGEKILSQISNLIIKNPLALEEITKLSGRFYSLIPHKIGQSTNVLSTPFLVEEKEELLQTMKDLVSVSESVSSGTSDVTKMQYHALRCSISTLAKNGAEFDSIAQQTIIGSGGTIKEVEAVYKIRREVEHNNFTNKIYNVQLLYHGSHIGNWLGVLSRGILMPKRVVAMGVKRTDAGQLGCGIYFGNKSLTSSRYSSEGKKGTNLMAMCTVALGNVYETQTSKWHLTAAPMNYHSCHGIPAQQGDFKEPHFAVYSQNQVRLEYLIEFVKHEEMEAREDTHNDEDEDPEQALVRKNDSSLVTRISELKKSSTNWRITIRVTYKSELLLWNSAKSRGNFFTADFIDCEKGRIHATAFRAHAVKLFPQLAEDKVYEVSGGSIRDVHENFTSIENRLEMVLDKNTVITPLDEGVTSNVPRLDVTFLPISETLALPDATVIDIIGLVTHVGEITELVSKHGNTIPRKILTMTCPPTFDRSTSINLSGPILGIEDFPTVQIALWYKDATQLTIKNEDVVAVTKAQVNEYKGFKKLNTKHCSHHIYINPSAAQFKEVSAMNMWAAEWFNAQSRTPATSDRPTSESRQSFQLPTPPSTVAPLTYVPSSTPSQASTAAPSISSHASTSSHLLTLSPQEVGQWLREHNLGRYAAIFEENDITGEILSQLSNQMLKSELGVAAFGHRFIIMKAFQTQASSIPKPWSIPKQQTLQIRGSEENETENRDDPINSGDLGKNTKEFVIDMARKLNRTKSGEYGLFLEQLKTRGCSDNVIKEILKHIPNERLVAVQREVEQGNPSLSRMFGPLREEIRNEEKYQKRMSNSTSSSISTNPEAHTITSLTPWSQITDMKIFDNYAQFERRGLNDTEKATTHIVFPAPEPDYYTPIGLPSCVETYEIFRRNFAEYTRAQLSNFSWANMIVAGGTVFTCLLREINKTNMFNGPSRTGDIDIFLVGLDAAAAERKIHALYNHIKNSNTTPFIVVRTNFAISFVSEYPNRTIQVILRLYKTIEEVLCYFDLDCVTVGYDGSNVFALPRAIRAFNTRTNFVDVLRFKEQTGSNDARMIKYLRRGFGTVIVKNQTIENGGLTPKVLAKVIGLQLKEDQTNPAKRKERLQIDKLIEEDPQQEQFKENSQNSKKKSNKPSSFMEDGDAEVPTENKEKEKYEDISFIPFGKEWDATKILEQLKKKLKESEDAHNAKGSSDPFVPFYIVGSFEEIMGLTSRAAFEAKWGKFPHKPQWNQGWA